MKSSFVTCLVLLLLASLGCKDDVDTNIKLELDACGVPINFGAIDKYPIISNIVFNPNNPDEFAFLKDRYAGTCCQQELVLYNMATKELKTIHVDNFWTFDWSKQGYIIWQDIFTRFLYRMTPTGDSLTQLPLDTLVDSTIFSGYPESQANSYALNAAGDRILFDFYSPLDGAYLIGIADLNGNILQRQYGNYLTPFKWYQADYLTSIYTPSDFYTALQFNDIEELMASPSQGPAPAVTFSGIGYPSYFEWADDRTVVLSTEKGIYTVNVPINHTNPVNPVLIMEAKCETVGRMRFAINREAKKLLVQRFLVEPLGNGPALRTIEYVMMNLDGTGEEIIEIEGL